MTLSKIAKRVKSQFLRENPHLYSNHPPVHLDESLELMERYFNAAIAEKKEKKLKSQKKLLNKKGNHGFHKRRCALRSRYVTGGK
jgi:hypothetical protein